MIINIITLGCSKNLVDSEYLLKQFKVNGHTVYHNAEDTPADILILNTCGFILDAKQESVDAILAAVAAKKSGEVKKVFVMGCLSERYREELKEELPEVDGFYGVWDQKAIVRAVGADFYPSFSNDRMLTTPEHYAFLKISEGCDRSCAFCAIPGIRGKQRSKSIESLTEEASNLAGKGVKELILIAQDLTSYGRDLNGKKQLAHLLQELTEVQGIEWIRLQYAYPSGFPDEVIKMMATHDKICNYLDIPIQHINDKMLRRMGRGHTRENLEKLLYSLRSGVPGVAIRTTLLTGFPGETEEAYREMYEFVQEFRFDRVGIFPYSHEEGTPAGKLEDDVPDAVKLERADKLMELQQAIALEKNQQKTGSAFKVIIDREESDYYIGRTEHDSPEVDNEVLIPREKQLQIGSFYQVKITHAEEFDLYGEVLHTI